jgi:hypothetical protein
MHRAIDVMIECQKIAVQWWDQHVRSQGEARKKIQDRNFLSVGAAEKKLAIRQQQIVRMVAALRDVEGYRERLIRRTRREVGVLAESEDQTSLRPTPARTGEARATFAVMAHLERSPCPG